MPEHDNNIAREKEKKTNKHKTPHRSRWLQRARERYEGAKMVKLKKILDKLQRNKRATKYANWKRMKVGKIFPIIPDNSH